MSSQAHVIFVFQGVKGFKGSSGPKGHRGLRGDPVRCSCVFIVVVLNVQTT